MCNIPEAFCSNRELAVKFIFLCPLLNPFPFSPSFLSPPFFFLRKKGPTHSEDMTVKGPEDSDPPTIKIMSSYFIIVIFLLLCIIMHISYVQPIWCAAPHKRGSDSQRGLDPQVEHVIEHSVCKQTAP